MKTVCLIFGFTSPSTTMVMWIRSANQSTLFLGKLPFASNARMGSFFLTLTHLRQRFLPATVTAIRYGLSAHRIRNRLWTNNNPFRACCPYNETAQACRGQEVQYHLGRTDWNRVCSVTNPDLHSIMLMVELGFIASQTCVIGIAACWKRINLVEALGWYGMG